MNDRTISKLMTLFLAVNGFGTAQAADDIFAQRDALKQESATYHSPPLGPMEFRYETHAAPAAGQAIELRIDVFPALPFAALTVEVYAHDGLIVTPLRYSVTKPAVGVPVEYTLTVTPYVVGPLSLSVLARGEMDGEPQSGQLTVPLQVGSPSQAPASVNGMTAPVGEKIISLPAREY